jgi:hypothetical protein
MAMRVLLRLQKDQSRALRFAVFLGGVTPDDSEQGVRGRNQVSQPYSNPHQQTVFILIMHIYPRLFES